MMDNQPFLGPKKCPTVMIGMRRHETARDGTRRHETPQDFLQASLAFAAAWVVGLAFDAALGVTDISDSLAHNCVNKMH